MSTELLIFYVFVFYVQYNPLYILLRFYLPYLIYTINTNKLNKNYLIDFQIGNYDTWVISLKTTKIMKL